MFHPATATGDAVANRARRSNDLVASSPFRYGSSAALNVCFRALGVAAETVKPTRCSADVARCKQAAVGVTTAAPNGARLAPYPTSVHAPPVPGNGDNARFGNPH